MPRHACGHQLAAGVCRHESHGTASSCLVSCRLLFLFPPCLHAHAAPAAPGALDSHRPQPAGLRCGRPARAVCGQPQVSWGGWLEAARHHERKRLWHRCCARLLPCWPCPRPAPEQPPGPASQSSPTASCPPLLRSFNKMVYCDGADGGVRIATVDKVTCLQAVPPGDPGGRRFCGWLRRSGRTESTTGQAAGVGGHRLLCVAKPQHKCRCLACCRHQGWRAVLV